MPKMKTHKGLVKRVRVSATGKPRYKKSNAGHLMSGKNGGRRRSLRSPGFMKGPMRKRVLRAMQA